MIDKLKCVTPALITPLKSNKELDMDGMKRLIKYIQGNGLSNLFVLGYAGECLSFGRERRKEVIKTARDAATPGTLLIAGVMDNSTELIAGHIKDAYECGADIVLSTPANFLHLTQDELKRMFTDLADSSKLPIIIYNCPENQHYIEPAVMSELSKHPQIIALKETSNIDKIQRMMFGIEANEDFILLSGEEFVYYPALSVGVEGFIMGGPGNMMPRLCKAVFDHYRDGDYLSAKEGYMRMIAFLYELYFSLPYSSLMPQIKAVLEIKGICSRQMADPMKSVTDEHMKEIESLMKKHGIEKE